MRLIPETGQLMKVPRKGMRIKPRVTMLHILIPDLFNHSNDGISELHLDSLELLLSRAKIENRAQADSLFTLFGLPLNTGIAPLTRLSDANDSGNKIWLRADPVFLRADRDRVFLFDAASAFNITQAEANAFIKEINAFYREDGIEFSAPTPTRWYVSISKHPDLITHPLDKVLARDIYDYMPEGKDQKEWRQRLNELQMLLHQSQVNTDRTERGEVPINSLWFWGLGKLPEPPTPCFTQVWTDEPLTQGLARLSNTPQSEVPDSASSCLMAGEHLITLPAVRGDSWQNWIINLETNWFTPLLKALKKRQIDKIALYLGDNRVFIITDKNLRSWWRRRKSWQSFVSEFEIG